jgi:hypothetical protein
MSKIDDDKLDRIRTDSVIPRSGLHVQMPPGAKAPRSGIYEQVGVRGGRPHEQGDSTRGKPLPPTATGKQGWKLIQPAHDEGAK